jgi:hypothetical protein
MVNSDKRLKIYDVLIQTGYSRLKSYKLSIIFTQKFHTSEYVRERLIRNSTHT